MWLKTKFTVELKDSATLTAYFGASTGGAALQKKLENIKCHPDMILGMLDNVEMRHNSIVFQRLKRDNMRAMRREQYTKEDHELQTRLLNGGIPKYHPIDGNKDALTKGTARRLTTTQTTGNAGFGLVHKPWTNHVQYAGMSDATNSNEKYFSQMEELAARVPDDEVFDLHSNFLPEFYHEIGTKDLNESALYNGSQGSSGANPGTNLGTRLAGLKWEFECYFEVPHPWHYSMSDAFPILNLVNDLECIFNFRPHQEWIQNHNEVSGFADVKLSDFSMIANYYDIPKSIWDGKYDPNVQMNFHAPDYQDWYEDHTLTLDGANVTKTYNVNTLDRVGRYLMVTVQDQAHRAGGTSARDHVFLDIIEKIYLEVNGEKLLTKIETPVEPYVKYQQRYQHFKEVKNYVPGEMLFLPLGLDGDIHNPGGGAINIRPFYNNLKLVVVYSHAKVKALHESKLPNFTKDAAIGSNVSSSFVSSNGSSYGAITVDPGNANKFTLNVRCQAKLACLDLVTYDRSQLYKQN